MNKKELILKGHRYVGRFIIEEHISESIEMVSSEVGNHPEHRVYRNYSGEGVISNIQDSSKVAFLIYTKGMEYSDLIVTEDKLRNKITDKKKIIDLSLEKMYQDSKSSIEIIPKIRPACLDEKILSKNGLI